MSKITCTIIYWNIWLELQNGKRDHARLISKFKQLLSDYDPDFIGLNEVVFDSRSQTSTVIELLKSAGYSVHFVPFSNISDDLVVGSALASKVKPTAIKDVPLGPDTQAQRRGYPNQSVSLIHGEYDFDGTPLTVTTNYLGNLIPLDWGTHRTHRKNFNAYVNQLKPGNVVIGGDFNEPKYLWPWLKLPKRFKRLTGSFTAPTWRLLGKSSLILSANYDYVLYDSSAQLQLKSFRVLDRKPSDHAPLLTTFTLG